jgi:organic radical activating enzyme
VIYVTRRYFFSFNSIQGEGLYTGVPTIWLRLFSCNLNCDGFGQKDPTNPKSYSLPYKTVDTKRITMLEELPVFKQGCDSSYSWSAKFKHLQHQDTPDDVAHKLHALIPPLKPSMTPMNIMRFKHPIHLCFTGGEPLVKPNQKQIVSVLYSYIILYGHNMPYNITFETNGTQKISNDLVEILQHCLGFNVLFSYSPKLFHVSGEHNNRALLPEVIAYNASCLPTSDFTLKFVLNTDISAWDEIEEFLDELEKLIPTARLMVYIMPVGADKESQDDIAGKVADMALARGYRVSARVHAYLWNNPIGK